MKLPARSLHAITYKFLIEGGDGYDMLKPLKWTPVAKTLKERIQHVLRTSTKPIQPKVDGRICNVAEIGRRTCVFNQAVP
jgi:hypothetical protein